MSTRAPFGPGDRVRARVMTDQGTTSTSGTVSACSPSAGADWTVQIRAAGTDHTFTVDQTGAVQNGYLERIAGIGVNHRNDQTTTGEAEDTQ